MSPNTRPNRFAPLRPTHSLRRLKTAFSPTRSMRSTSPSSISSISSTSTCSPLTRTSSPDAHAHSVPAYGSDYSPNSQRSASGSVSGNSIRELLMLRRKPSVLEVEVEEERKVFGNELSLLEPRPMGLEMGMGGVGIFEVLDGKF